MDEMIAFDNDHGYSRHENGCFWDNRRCNVVTGYEELHEDFAACDGNQNKVSGIQYMDAFGKWMATVIKNHCLILVGLYDSIFDAAVAWTDADRFRYEECVRLLGEYYHPNKHVDGKLTDFHSSHYLCIDGLYLGFPVWYDSEKRCDLVKVLTDSRPDLFEYHLPENERDNHPELVSKRLDILSTYVIASTYEHKSGDIISAYRLSKIREHEIPMSYCIDDIFSKNGENIRNIVK